MTYRIGVDIGGTFTDLALFDDAAGTAITHKLLTSPDEPSRSVLAGVVAIAESAGIAMSEVSAISHGTTLVTNAVIERRGVPTALVTTEGFSDVLDIALERRYDLFDMRIAFPQPMVARNQRLEVRERIRDDGSVVTAPDRAGLEAGLARLVEEQGIQAVAVCFLNSYANPAHERLVAGWIRERFPELYVSLSSTVFPYPREYERWTTTCMNAYVQPIVDRYLARLEAGLGEIGFTGKFLVMSSSGGTLASSIAREFPIRLLESGPAAGALMSAHVGKVLDERNVLAFDMGGTTAKGCIIRGGTPIKRYEMEVARVHEFKGGSGLPAKIPVIDMIEIGSGGGSLAGTDERGTLAMGPRSAGADPGPACYGRGGERATLSDANLLLGYLGAGSFLGGKMALDEAAARKAIGDHVAEKLNVDLVAAAWGMHEVINEDVARAFRVHASERGIDYRRSSMVVFGGSGPLHGVRVARKLKIPKVICPAGAGVMSAFGLLSSPPAFEVVRSRQIGIDRLAPADLAAICTELEAEAAEVLATGGVAPEAIRFRRRLDMRYSGQGYEVEVALPDEGDPQCLHAALPQLFNEAYAAIFGMTLPGRPIEILNWKIEAYGPLAAQHQTYRVLQEPEGEVALKGSRKAYFPDAGGFVDCPVYDRYALASGDQVSGPALIEERESTCVLGPGDHLTVDPFMNLVIEIR